VKLSLPMERISIGAATERWLREDVVPVYDAMEANPARGISAEQVLASLRARHVSRMNKRKE
jgi:antitoxin ParD1/3/4